MIIREESYKLDEEPLIPYEAYEKKKRSDAHIELQVGEF